MPGFGIFFSADSKVFSGRGAFITSLRINPQNLIWIIPAKGIRKKISFEVLTSKLISF